MVGVVTGMDKSAWWIGVEALHKSERASRLKEFIKGMKECFCFNNISKLFLNYDTPVT